MPCRVNIKSFDKLSTTELYYILQARAQVFGLEQKGSYQDIDEKDFKSTHVTVHRQSELVGYCRIVSPKLSKDTRPPKKYLQNQQQLYPNIDKILILEKHRGYGLATNLMNQAIKHTTDKYPKQLIVINSHDYLTKFFQSLGSQVASEPYVKNKIKHVDMVLGSKKKIKVKPVKKTKVKKQTSVFRKLIGLILFLLSIMIIAGVLYLMY